MTNDEGQRPKAIHRALQFVIWPSVFGFPQPRCGLLCGQTLTLPLRNDRLTVAAIQRVGVRATTRCCLNTGGV